MAQTTTTTNTPAMPAAMDDTLTALADLGFYSLRDLDADTLLINITDGELVAQHLEHMAQLIRADFNAASITIEAA